MTLKSYVKSTKLFRLVRNSRWGTMIRLILKAKRRFAIEGTKNGSLSDYKKACKKHLVSYSEYMYQYRFWKLDERQRDEFISRAQMRMLYNRIISDSVDHLFRNKAAFLRRFSPFIHRRWLAAGKSDFEQFKELITSTDCIAKPMDGSIGDGIFKINRYLPEEEITGLYARCREENLLIEEIIHNTAEIRAFHPQSLNTIRVHMINCSSKLTVLGSFIRFGWGDSIIDNAHAGGIFAQINPANGIIESDGITCMGKVFAYHPDTGLKIKGFAIPHWNKIIDTCKEAARMYPEAVVVGWDVVENSEHMIEFVEGNSTPDIDVIQAPLRTGLKEKVYDLLFWRINGHLI